MSGPRIHITGASGCGVTTLGAVLGAILDIPHLDVDDAYWVPSDPPFTTKRPPEARVARLRDKMSNSWVLSGSLDSWGTALVADADLIVFLSAPTAVRLDRLRNRERARFGSRIDPGGDMYDIHRAFLDWAERYDDPTFNGRNHARHTAWLGAQSAPVLRLDSSRPVDWLVSAVCDALRAG
jgi:adenylate kinase family enzyme